MSVLTFLRSLSWHRSSSKKSSRRPEGSIRSLFLSRIRALQKVWHGQETHNIVSLSEVCHSYLSRTLCVTRLTMDDKDAMRTLCCQIVLPFSGLTLRLCGYWVITQTTPVERWTGAAGSNDQPAGIKGLKCITYREERTITQLSRNTDSTIPEQETWPDLPAPCSACQAAVWRSVHWTGSVGTAAETVKGTTTIESSLWCSDRYGVRKLAALPAKNFSNVS